MLEEVFVCPCSSGQRRLWFLDQLAPGNAFYNVPLAIPVTTPIDAAVLERTLNEIVRRHEALRTTFQVIDGQPAQVIIPSLRVEVPVVDLQPLPEAERDREAQRVASEEAQRPFDLASGPLVRACLLRLGAGKHVFLLTLHHIVCDGWSMGILWRELAAIYPACAMGRASPLAELPLQYADFAVWQNEWMSGATYADQLSCWKQRLADASPLELPSDRVRPATPSFQGGFETISLPRTLTSALKGLSQREGVTLFMTLLAAFKVLLCRYTGEEDIIIGCPVAGRSRQELEGLIGFFVNTLVMRTDLSGDPTFRDALARVRETAMGAYEHQDLPFEKLVEELHPQRSSSRNPLFQVIFQLLTLPGESGAAQASSRPAQEPERGSAQFDLRLDLRDTPDGIRGQLEYSKDLFEPETAVRMAGHYRILLQAIVDNPTQSIWELPLLTVGERRQVLEEWNQTTADYESEIGIHQLFETQAANAPDAVAVVDGDTSLTYDALNRRATSLAQHLRSFQVGPGVLVGVFLERSADLVVALIGILKAGGAYVPLDIGYPPARLAFMIEDSRSSVIVTRRELASLLPTDTAQLVFVEQDNEPISAVDLDGGSPNRVGDRLAYVMYTSGSTGCPKGVCVVHRAVNRLVRNANYITVGSYDSIAHISNVAFDAATFEIWSALLNGGRLVVIRQEVVLSHRLFASALREHRISALFITTPLFHQIAREAPATFATVRDVLVGGSTLDPRAVREVLQAGPPRRLLNVYGPTENTTFTTWQSLVDVPDDAANVPIGRPISNTQVYVLGRHAQPVPVGVPGELHVAGDGLARGYWNNVDLTQQKFVANPFGVDPGALMYRTGDLVRFRTDGAIEFLGRMDDQIKIRGFRVEPGEIEVALAQHPAIHTAAVLAREAAGGDKQLIAFLVSHQDPPPSQEELRQFLGERLPDYMIPSAFAMLESLPLTPNGKIDRDALRVADEVCPRVGAVFVAPRTPLEQILAKFWAEIHGLEHVGVHDNFFELGGHSLLAAQLVSRIRNSLQLELPLRTLFERPTIAGLAAAMEEDGDERIRLEKTAELVFAVERLSEDEIEAMLAARDAAKGGRQPT